MPARRTVSLTLRHLGKHPQGPSARPHPRVVFGPVRTTKQAGLGSVSIPARAREEPGFAIRRWLTEAGPFVPDRSDAKQKDPTMPQIIPDDKARQGPSGRPVLGVLIGALALLAVAVTGYLVWVGSTSPDNPSQDAARQTATGDPKGSGDNPTNRVPSANPAYPAPAEPNATGATRP
jgi:hypothetical protein